MGSDSKAVLVNSSENEASSLPANVTEGLYLLQTLESWASSLAAGRQKAIPSSCSTNNMYSMNLQYLRWKL